MRGVYVVRDTITAVTAAKVLMYLATPSDKVIEILSARITCQDEDTSEQIFATLARATGSVGGGDPLTPKPTEEGSAISGVTAKGGNTAITGMTQDTDSDAIHSAGANKLAGWEYVPLPEEREAIKPSDFVTFQTIDAIANASDLTVEIRYREIG